MMKKKVFIYQRYMQRRIINILDDQNVRFDYGRKN